MKNGLIYYRKIFYCFFLGLLFIPALETWGKWLPEQYVVGYEPLYKLPNLTLTAWLSGNFQKQFDAWYQQHIGFRSALIKTSNQVDFSLFHETNSSSQYILGKHNYLYEAIYLNSFNRLDNVSPVDLAKTVINLKKLQNVLHRRGVTLLIAITPSKAAVYPEFIPKKYLLIGANQQPDNYDKLVSLLNQYQVNYVDGHKLMMTLKASAYPPFTAGGTHWNYYGACEFAQMMLNKIASLTKKPIAYLNCTPVHVDDKASGTDHDLTDLINIWTPQAITSPVPHPTVTVAVRNSLTKPKILLVGSSFFITLQDIFKGRAIFAKRTFFHYYDTIMDNTTDMDQPLDKHKIDWQKNILSYNVIVIEANEARLDPLYSKDQKNEIGYGFVEDALHYL